MTVPANAFELHIHTSEVSRCGQAPAAECVQRCVAMGYAGMVVTDHMSRDRIEKKGLSNLPWREQAAYFLQGYHAAKAAAPAGFVVLPGMEFCFEGCDNDYLLYGMEEDYLAANENIDMLSLKDFSEKVRGDGLFFAQAHPFRFGMRLIRPTLLDGTEVYNGNSHHESNNAIAEAWAARWQLRPLSGSDYHGGDTGDGRAPGGVVFSTPVRSSADLLQALHAGAYTLLKE